MTVLTKAELIVMRCIWELGDGASKIEIENQIESRFHKGWRPTTVSTFLSHLREKGYVDFTRKGRDCCYTSLISEKVYKEAQMKEMFEFWGKRNVGTTLASFFEEQGMDAKSAEKVKEMIDELDF